MNDVEEFRVDDRVDHMTTMEERRRKGEVEEEERKKDRWKICWEAIHKYKEKTEEIKWKEVQQDQLKISGKSLKG